MVVLSNIPPSINFSLNGDLSELYRQCFYSLLFLNVVWWFMTDRSKKNSKKSFVFALWQTSSCTIFTAMFMLTHNKLYSIATHAWFLSGMFMDFAYGFIYFPEDMYMLTTNVHHVAYFLLEYYIITVVDFTGIFSLYFLQEFPTFMLNLKRYYNIQNNSYENAFCVSFFLLRIVYYNYINYLYMEIILSGDNMGLLICNIIVNYMHISWWWNYMKDKPNYD